MNHQMKITVIEKRSTDFRTQILLALGFGIFITLNGDDWQTSLIYAFKVTAPMILVVVIVNYFIAPFISTSLHYQIDDQRLRCGAEKTTYWQVPLIHITKVETKERKGKVVEAIVHTGKDSFQMMELERFEPAAVQDFLHQLDYIASSNLAAQHGLSA